MLDILVPMSLWRTFWLAGGQQGMHAGTGHHDDLARSHSLHEGLSRLDQRSHRIGTFFKPVIGQQADMSLGSLECRYKTLRRILGRAMLGSLPAVRGALSCLSCLTPRSSRFAEMLEDPLIQLRGRHR
jgi:hypothetical protein